MTFDEQLSQAISNLDLPTHVIKSYMDSISEATADLTQDHFDLTQDHFDQEYNPEDVASKFDLPLKIHFPVYGLGYVDILYDPIEGQIWFDEASEKYTAERVAKIGPTQFLQVARGIGALKLTKDSDFYLYQNLLENGIPTKGLASWRNDPIDKPEDLIRTVYSKVDEMMRNNYGY